MKINRLKEYFGSRKELFSASLRFGILNYFIFVLIGIYCRIQAYISENSLIGELYTLVLFVALPGVLALLLALITGLGACFNKIAMWIIGTIAGIFCTTYLLIDAVVFTQYQFHIDSAMLALFLSDAGLELIPFSTEMFLMAAAAFLIIIAAISGLMFLAVKMQKKIWTKCSLYAAIVFLSGFIIYNGWHAVATFKGNFAIMERNQIFPGNFGLTSKRLLTKLGFKPGNKFDMNRDRGTFHYPKNPLQFESNAPKYNIVFVLVDALRGDMVTPEVMPYLSKFAEEGAYFSNHFSNGNCTRNGMFALFSGVHGTYWNQALSAGRGSVLVDSCLDRGYQTGIFFSATLTNPEFDRTIFAKVSGMTLKRNGSTKLERDYEAVNDFKKFVKNRDRSKPAFSVIMYDSLHGYIVPENFKVPFPDAYKSMNYLALKKDDREQQKKVYNLIRNSSAFIDVQLKDMMEFLKKEYDWENTIFIITSDHGNEANESGNNIWGHNSKFSRYQLHVPLIIAGGPIKKGKFDHRTYHIDVVPTLMKMLGCKNPFSDYSSGRWIWEDSNRELMIFSSYSNRAMLYDDKIYEMNRNGIVYNYDLEGKNIKSPPSGKLTRQFLDEISRFSR
ncbi:MAG: DUF3413 domain-containing protein [Lentisphaerae bacterium]|nr:DUF3413 domain-containing protein [Lentisphaerota bacterium]